MQPPASILVAMYQGYPGGSDTPFYTPIFARLVERGHAVRILIGPGVRETRLPVSDLHLNRLISVGATIVPFRQPETHPLENMPPAKGLVGHWMPTQFRNIAQQALTILWATAWADNVAVELRRAPTDVLVADYVLLGALVGAEAERVHSVALQHMVGPRPAAGLPPFGTGWPRSRSPVGKARNALGRFAIESLYRRNGLSLLNAARTRHKLPPVRSVFEQYDRASRVLMLVSPTFDFERHGKPANMRQVGTPMGDSGTSNWQSPWGDSARPLVVASLSTLPQGQAPLMRNILLALSKLDVNALVTLGLSLDPNDFVAPPNVVLERFVPHAAVLPQAAVLVTQCGIGTVTKGLTYGLPLVCVPILADQPDNAVRVAARGAGLHIASDAYPDQIAAAIQRVLNDGAFRAAAQRLGAEMAREGDAVDNVVSAIEEVLATNGRGNSGWRQDQ
jgi:UDP:flavonoid glycosyltransferase YjiC (YdhE family)